MNCDICQRVHHPQRLPFLCAVDARNELYEGRVANAKVLMEMEAIESRVNKLLSDTEVVRNSSATRRDSRPYVENCVSEECKAKERTERIIASADKLRDEVAAAKREIRERRATIARKRSELAAVSQGQPARRNRQADEIRKATKMAKYHWDREYEAMTQYKAALCVPPELISASLSHITHLLFLASHYLAIRLPAEITLPHNDYPRPTIFSLSSSYQHGEVAFPGSSPVPPDPRDLQFANVPFPRPLFLDKPLTTLAREDPANYNAFLEAVCLLAYDIAWLCRTQGVPVGDNNSQFDVFGGIGRNLYALLINSSLQRNPQQIADDVGNQSMASEGNEASELGKAAPRMGLYSHGSGHTFLGSTIGNDLTRNFKLPNPIKLADKLKARLNHENPIPEWEVLEDDAWALDDADEAVLVGGERPKPKIGERGAQFGAESYISVATVKGGGDGDERDKNTKHWTMVKPRQST